MNSSFTTLDKVRGMLMGAFLGDALGAPHEFRVNAKVPYTGKLEHNAFNISKYQGRQSLQVSQVSDDSELILTLLRSIIKDQKYIRDNVIMSYLKWANSGGWMIGKNTRALLKGVTTLKGYQNRVAKHGLTSQSNGALMRCSPLALLNDNDCVLQDLSITNFNAVCADCELIYVAALRLALRGNDGMTIFNHVYDLVQTAEVKAVFDQVLNNEPRNIAENKGWCLHGLWCSVTAMISFNSYSEAIDWVITAQKGSDTDTNACIAGALIGAILGFEALQSEPITNYNIEMVLTADIDNGPTPRPHIYQPKDFYTLTEDAYSLTFL